MSQGQSKQRDSSELVWLSGPLRVAHWRSRYLSLCMSAFSPAAETAPEQPKEDSETTEDAEKPPAIEQSDPTPQVQEPEAPQE